MIRYFIEVAYKGTRYSGFQIQKNANSVQQELEKALAIFYHQSITLTGSSRTDAGVHALQNFFHFDFEQPILQKSIYNLNALLPDDIVIKNIQPVTPDAHCRFDAISRKYQYFIYAKKNPFFLDRAFFYPYTLNIQLLNEAADTLYRYTDYTSFSKRRTQVKSHECQIMESHWMEKDNMLVFTVKANRFLRGMIKGLVGTMLQVGREKISLSDFKKIIEAKNASKVDFSVPSKGLFLVEVRY